MMRLERGTTKTATDNPRCRQHAMVVLFVTFALGVIVAGCSSHERRGQGVGSGESETNASPNVTITPEARKEAKQIFSSQCATCHGPQGRGDGPGAARLSPRP